MFFAALNFFYISSAQASSWCACCDIDDAVNPNTVIDNGITSGNTGNNAKPVDGNFHSLSRENAFSSQQEAENPKHNNNRSVQAPYKNQNITIQNDE